MANSGKQTIGIVSSVIVIIAIMAVKFVGINTIVHLLKFW
ncbi:preprotein translocase subunit SecE [Lysinibacillus sp. RC79]